MRETIEVSRGGQLRKLRDVLVAEYNRLSAIVHEAESEMRQVSDLMEQIETVWEDK